MQGSGPAKYCRVEYPWVLRAIAEPLQTRGAHIDTLSTIDAH